MSSYADIFTQTWAVLLVILFFGGSIFVHEFGHFLAAKWRGLKVLRFSIGFGPKLFSWRGADGCEYRISLLPLGGYVALPQLADMGALEGGSEADFENDGESETGYKKNLSFFDKFAVSAAGAFFNVLFAAILACGVWILGMPESGAYNTNQVGFVPESLNTIDSRSIDNPAYLAGIKEGDKILKVDGREVSKFTDILEYVMLGSGRTQDGRPSCIFTVERDGKVFDVAVNPVLYSTNPQTVDSVRMVGLLPAMKLKVVQVLKNSAADKAGLKAGDVVVSVGGQKMYSNQQVSKRLESLADGESIDFQVERGGKSMLLTAKPGRIYTTRPLCTLKLGESGGEIALMTRGGDQKEAHSVDMKGRVAVYSVDKSDPRLARIEAGDVLVKISDKPISTLTQVSILAQNAAKNGGTALVFLGSDGSLKEIVLPRDTSVKISPAGEKVMLGYMVGSDMVTVHPGVWEQFEDALRKTWDSIASLVNPKSDVGISQLAGPVDIVRIMHKLSLSDFSLILSFAVLLNINLAILNLLPIPVLDGGHILFALIAKLRGEPMPERIVASLQGVFMLLFMALMFYVIYGGMWRWAGDRQMSDYDGIRNEYFIDNPINFDDDEK